MDSREELAGYPRFPSAALRAEWNVLVNPLHNAIAEIWPEEPEPFIYARMYR